MKVPQYTLFGFRRPREVVGSALGKLEKTVMVDRRRPLKLALALCLCAAGAPLLTHPETLRATHAAIERVVEHLT